jgi:hypothetical protein
MFGSNARSIAPIGLDLDFLLLDRRAPARVDRLRIPALAGNALTSNDTVRLGVPTGRRSGRVLVGTVTGIDVVRAVRRGRALGPQLGTRYEALVLAGRSEGLTDESARKPRQARTLSGQRRIRR